MKALPHLYFMHVRDGLIKIINFLNDQHSVVISTNCKSGDDGLSANRVMILYILWPSDIGRYDFSNIQSMGNSKNAFASSRVLPLCFIFVLVEFEI
jgi:hypothetical protein